MHNFSIEIESILSREKHSENQRPLLPPLIDELGKQVTERKEQSERLMQSVLREAFSQ